MLKLLRATPAELADQRAQDIAAMHRAIARVFHEHGFTTVRAEIDGKLNALAKANAVTVAKEGWIV